MLLHLHQKLELIGLQKNFAENTVEGLAVIDQEIDQYSLRALPYVNVLIFVDRLHF